LAHNISDITVVEKKQVWLVDVAIPGDSRIQQKEVEKNIKYQDLKIEVERLWERKVTVLEPLEQYRGRAGKAAASSLSFSYLGFYFYSYRRR
jgi:putative methionine-R-sulfoxide reductase with GAF domain